MCQNKLPIQWSKKDLYDMALKIKEHPEDINLKNTFLNLIPGTGEYFNMQLYMILKDCYYIYSGKYLHYCTLDDFIEMNLFHIYRRSFSDWNPEYSLATYFKLLTRPNGIIGKFIMDEMKRYSILDSFDEIKEAELADPDSADIMYTFTVPDEKETEYDLMEEILPVIGLNAKELKFLLALDGKDFHTKEALKTVNKKLGTNYTLEEVKAIRRNIFRKLKRRTEAICRFFRIQ